MLGDEPATQEQAERLVTLDDIEAVGGDASGVEQTVEDQRAFAELVNPEAVEDARALLSISFARGDVGSAVIVNVADLTSPAGAHLRMDSMVQGLGTSPLEPVIGDRSIDAETTIGGAMVAFISGQRLVSIQTTQLDEDDAILTAPQVEALARRIAGRF